ncbi:YwmB family TATA-box binding protein [Pseudogracilibacillus sp. SE30717A]|uniref:YwmB family TATA-box binding protein n=1 Tax=Pseudogracilibacillus sp. SE30717A TaxID=3098293 RepID=UPI00300E54F0
MKKIIFIVSISFLLNHTQFNHLQYNELSLLAEAGQNEGWDLKEWQAVAFLELTPQEYDNLSNKLQNSYLVTMEENENAVKYIFETNERDELITHSFYTVIPTKGEQNITVQAIFFGEEWDDMISDYYDSLIKALQKDYNIKFSKIFTCLKFEVSGIINNGFSIDEFWQKMNVVHRKEQYDNVQQSIYEKEVYGYSPLWSNTITVDNEPINFHMTIKNDEANKKQVIVGTPMILNEY